MVAGAQEREEAEKEARPLLVNFVVMALAFSVNHGTVSAVITLATGELGVSKGSASIGVLYFAYVLTAMFLSTAIIETVGRKGSLVLGVLLYCVYVGAFCFAMIFTDTPPPPPALSPLLGHGSCNGSCNGSWAPLPQGAGAFSCKALDVGCGIAPDARCCGNTWSSGSMIVLFGSMIGGVAAGFLWSAQGAYFADNAAQYARLAKVTKETATAKFSGIFAVLYLSFEVVMKLLSSILPVSVKWIFFVVAAIASSFVMTTIMPLGQPTDGEEADKGAGKKPKTGLAAGCAKVGGALELLVSDEKVALMAPTEAVFGFAAGMMNAWVNGFLVPNTVGKEYIGYLATVTTIVAAGASAIGAWYTTHSESIFFQGKPAAMLFGDGCFALLAVILMISSCATLGSWPVLVTLYVLQGLGRGVFESTNKAVFADFFTGEKAGPGFANFVILSGSASTVMLFTIPHFQCLADHGQSIMSTIVFVTALLAIPTYLAALKRHSRSQLREGLLVTDMEDMGMGAARDAEAAGTADPDAL